MPIQAHRNPVIRTSLGLITALVLTSGVAHAQQAVRDDFTRQLDLLRREELLQASPDVPAGQRAFVDYGAYLTFDYLTVDDNLRNNHVLRQTDVVGYTRMNFDGVHELFLRFRTGWRDFNDGDSFDGRGDERIDGDLDLGYYRFDLSRYMGAYKGQEMDSNVAIKLGRDIVYWGNGLSIGQVIDGVQVELSKGDIAIEAIAGVTPVRTVDFEATRPDFDFHTRRGFYGLMASTQVESHRPFVYALMQTDYNKDEVYELAPITTKFGYDSYYFGVGSNGSIGDRIIYGAELVYESGRSRSNSFDDSGEFLSQIEQTTDDICAYAADFRLDYLVPDERRTRFSGEFLVASGDDDRRHTSNTFEGNAPNTRDNAFNAFSLINTGQAFAPAVSNLLMFRAGVSSYPFSDIPSLRRLQLGLDVFAYGRTSTSAPIDEPLAAGTDERFLGWEPDLYLNWQITSDITLAVRYGVFFPNSDAFDDDKARQFFSTSVTFAF